MRLVELLLLFILVSLISVTYYYWKKQNELEAKGKKRAPKYELVEVSSEAKQYDEYYEPKIIEIVSSDEYL